jgi:Flp pilus assembly protein TadG
MRGIPRLHVHFRSERGVTLPLVAMLTVALLGATALAVDIGRLAATRRQLQNAADAAALAGAARLPGDASGATADANTWATRNGLSSSEVSSVQVTTTNFTDDTINVTVHRNVSYAFARVLGLTNRDVTATAQVTLYVVQGADTQGASIFPYAVWGGNKGGPADAEKVGNIVTFRSNNYAGANVQPNSTYCVDPSSTGDKKSNNCNWNINSGNFKGYFHWHDRYVYIDPDTPQVQDQGGNSFGTEPVTALYNDFQNHNAIWLPLITYADNNGTDLHFEIVNFVCVEVTQMDNSGSVDWRAKVLDQGQDPRCKKSFGLINGGENPPPDLEPQYTFKLTE